uniref:PiggyBac transposable element-derived protein domain-containing protein n=1 Tax=Periophthalmus magnuspinnatus TaxID=409849 RepID=A0A3B4A5I8_9GOBI
MTAKTKTACLALRPAVLLLFAPPDSVKTFQYFKMLFTDEMILHIAHQTNLYSAHELGDPIKTNPCEIEDFLAMLLFMGVFNFPAMEDYWHPASRFKLTADIMLKRRFTLLRCYIHFNDNQQCDGSPDRFYKIWPLFEMLRKQCLLIPSIYKHSVDEVMVSYKGTRAGTLRQYFANKPDKWGFKVFCRASSSGIIHGLLLYQGPSTFFNVDLSEEEQELPLGIVFCDNYFTSFDLVLSLHANLSIKCIGTVCSNCIGGTHLIEDEELMKRGCGALHYKSTEGVLAVKWYDNKCVTLLSNASGIKPLTSVQRWSKDAKVNIAVQCPSLIAAYNQDMSGIHLSDMLVYLYKTPAKSQRWYFPLFGYALDLCISNSWFVYKRDCDLLKEKTMPLKRFRLAVAHSLKQANKPAPRVGQPPRPQPDVRYDNYGHWPLHTDNLGWCSLCPKGVSCA